MNNKYGWSVALLIILILTVGGFLWKHSKD